MNIEPVNAEGVHELMVIGTALKNAHAVISEELPDQDTQLLKIDEAISIIDRIIENGFDSIVS